MDPLTFTVVVLSFAPALACIGAALRVVLDPRDLSPAGAGFGWAGLALGIGALMLASQTVGMGHP